MLCSLARAFYLAGSFENEALENEDRSTKHPNLENEAPKSRKRSTLSRKRRPLNLENEAPKSRKRSTQISKTKHPDLENEAPYLENEAPKTRKRRPLNLENESPKNSKPVCPLKTRDQSNANTAGIKHDNEFSCPPP